MFDLETPVHSSVAPPLLPCLLLATALAELCHRSKQASAAPLSSPSTKPLHSRMSMAPRTKLEMVLDTNPIVFDGTAVAHLAARLSSGGTFPMNEGVPTPTRLF